MSGRGPEDTLNEGTPPSIAAIDDYLGVSRGMSVARTFSCEVSSAGAARHWAAAMLDSWGLTPRSQLSDDVVLCASELVSNAIQHAQAAPQVELRVDETTVQLMVTDQRADLYLPLRLGTEGQLAIDGRGLGLVADRATVWGVRHSIQGRPSKTVWCQFALPGRLSDGSSR